MVEKQPTRRSTRPRSTPPRLNDYEVDSNESEQLVVKMDSLTLQDQSLSPATVVEVPVPVADAPSIAVELAAAVMDGAVPVAESIEVEVTAPVVELSADPSESPVLDTEVSAVVDTTPIVVAAGIENEDVPDAIVVSTQEVTDLCPSASPECIEVEVASAPSIALELAVAVAESIVIPEHSVIAPVVELSADPSESPALDNDEVFEVVDVSTVVEEQDRTMSIYFEEISMNVCQYELEYLKREGNKKDSTIKNLKQNLVAVEQELLTTKSQSKNMIDQLRSQEKDLMEGEKTILTLREDLLEKQLSLAGYIANDGQLQQQIQLLKKTAEQDKESSESEKIRLEANVQFLMDDNTQLKNAMKVNQDSEKVAVKSGGEVDLRAEFQALKDQMQNFKESMCEKLNEIAENSNSPDTTLNSTPNITEDLEEGVESDKSNISDENTVLDDHQTPVAGSIQTPRDPKLQQLRNEVLEQVKREFQHQLRAKQELEQIKASEDHRLEKIRLEEERERKSKVEKQEKQRQERERKQQQEKRLNQNLERKNQERQDPRKNEESQNVEQETSFHERLSKLVTTICDEAGTNRVPWEMHGNGFPSNYLHTSKGTHEG